MDARFGLGPGSARYFDLRYFVGIDEPGLAIFLDVGEEKHAKDLVMMMLMQALGGF